MSVIPEQFKLEFTPVAAHEAVVQIGHARFTVLSERLLRIEYHPENCFEDRASQAFWYRHQPVPEFSVQTDDNGVEIETTFLHLKYSSGGSGFTPDNLSIAIKGFENVWHYGDIDDKNLYGTTRTLDFINGYVPLEQGLMSRAGWSIIDDSNSLVFNEECWLVHREAGGSDFYFFGFGHDYRACLRDYCAVSGKIPVIPRWALGNWWSRYWSYTQADLTALINDFERYQLPFSVCIIDMDWHITVTNNASTGWTGYTWNRELFPDPKGFIDFAHSRNLKTALNLHPAEGIHSHEVQYEEMARRVGIDPATKQPVLFNITDPTFAKAYFEVLHHPYEEMGIDFWWVDWQQGQSSALVGLDPLWLINHLHFYDLARDGVRRPFIFSRWGREGHQRYPIGFSGDSYITWDTLAFQPYMTAAASNIAYGWWSHDIGGHTSGVEDSELFTRWVQLGVFSPINRIHVTKGYFYDRRPWAFEDAEVLRVLREALQLRHAFIPYLYTMARRAHDDSQPLILPMYYDYPEDEAAYHCPHQYLFGTELIATPFTAPADEHTGLSRQVVWLPQGDWYNFFTGEHFIGNRWHAIYGRLEDIPLFAKAGAILPLASKVDEHGVVNPDALHIHLFAGADNSFTLYEDDGETTAYLDDQACRTTFAQKWQGNQLTFTISAAQGVTSLIPSHRSYQLSIHGVQNAADITATIDGQPVTVTTSYDAKTETLCINGIELDAASALQLSLRADTSQRNRQAETVLRLLKFFKLHTGIRNTLAQHLDDLVTDPYMLATYVTGMTESQARALFETLYDAGIHCIRDTDQPTRLILWNNQQNQKVTFRYGEIYLYFGSVQSVSRSDGIVPMFTKFIPTKKQWSHGAQGENVHRTQWRLQIDYCNLFTMTENYSEETP